ncbi:MAG TPA: M23 family metallopeptidase [Solirubrobacteraceae bacterium]|nr:M23 family metallopeptidase [Solirubrobacteraceae bacterium]
MRRIIATTAVLAAFPAAAQARYAEGGGPEPAPAPFPIDGEWEWGGASTHFGDRGGAHDGEDLMSDCGTPIVAAAGGKVVFADSDGAAGNYLVVRGEEDHVYMHLARETRFEAGDRVRTGERLGSVGRTGNASTCHLHFEIWTAPGWYDGGKARDPRGDLKRWSRGTQPAS